MGAYHIKCFSLNSVCTLETYQNLCILHEVCIFICLYNAPINVTHHHPQHWVRWGFLLAGFTMSQGWGSCWHANPLHIPHLVPTGAQFKQRTLCYMSAFCMFTKVQSALDVLYDAFLCASFCLSVCRHFQL